MSKYDYGGLWKYEERTTVIFGPTRKAEIAEVPDPPATPEEKPSAPWPPEWLRGSAAWASSFQK